ncbi:hypothetical protein ACKGJF_002304 [Raoultella ornithinolytica]
MLREDLSKNGLRAVLFCLKMCAVGAFKDKFARELWKMPQPWATTVLDSQK